MQTTKARNWQILLILMLIVFVLAACSPTDAAQQEVDISDDAQVDTTSDDDDDDTNIEFTGTITSFQGAIIVVNGLTVNIETANVVGDIEDDAEVTVAGNLENGVVIAISIVVIQVDVEVTPEATAEMTPEATVEATAEATAEATPDDDHDDDDDDDVTIVIEGPVESININIITIYGLNIELDEDDALLTVIQIGDVIRIEGDYHDDDDGDNTIIIVAINIIFINIEVYVLDGEVWRDSENCQNPPPPWAPAHGWRNRCESGGGGAASNRGGGGRGRGGSNRGSS